MRLVCALVLACGCHASSGAPADLAHPGDAQGVTAPSATIVATPDLVGFVTRLDGTGSAGNNLTYAWHFTQVPSGSNLGDSAFSSASGPTPTFDPDVGGVYTVQLTVTAPDQSSGSTSADVTVPTLPLFYREGEFPATGAASFSVGVVRSDGSGAHRVSCAVSSSGPGDLGGDDLFDLVEVPGLLGLRVWDPPSPSPAALSRVAYEDVTPMIAGGVRTLAHSLWLTDEAGDCTARPPVRLDDQTTPAQAKLGPRFSPDGTRLAYLDVGAPSRLVTVAVDGSAQHVVRTGKLVAAPPVWIDGTHLAWVEDTAASPPPPHLVFSSAADAAGAGDTAATTLLDCAPGGDALQVVNQFERLSDGTLLVAGGTKSKTANPPGSINLYRMGATCSTGAARLLVTPGVAGDAWDFAVAPDGVTLVLSSSVVQAAAPAPQHDLYVVPADGSAAAVRYSGSDALQDDVGPRWLAGGRQISWTQAARPDDAGTTVGAGVLVANLNGTHRRSLAPEKSGAQGRTALVTGSNRGLACDFSDGGLPLSAVALVLLLLARALRRGGAA